MVSVILLLTYYKNYDFFFIIMSPKQLCFPFLLKMVLVFSTFSNSIYIEINGVLPVKKMNNLTKLNIKLFHICLYHWQDRRLNFLVITYKTMAT